MAPSLPGITGNLSPVRALEAGWLALALLVPITFQRWSYDAFELPKQLVTFVALETALLVALALWLARRPWRHPRRFAGDAILSWLGAHPAALAAGGVALVWLLATATSLAPEQSWWGLPPRWAGTRAQLAHAALFTVCALALTRPAQLLRLSAATALAGALASSYALVQRAGRDPFEWGGFLGAQRAADLSIRPPGTFGNPNFLAGYLAIALFVTLGALLAVRRPWARALLAGALCLEALALLFSQTRGAWVGAVIGGMVFVTYLLALRGGPWRRTLLGLGVLALAAALALRAAQPLLPPGSLLARAADALSPTEDTASIRLTLWRLVLPEWQERPWLGYGPDAIGPVFQRIYGPELVEAEGALGGTTQYDRSENATIDTLLAAGAAGATALALIGLLVCRALWRHVARRGHAPPALIAGATAALAAHLTAQQFNVEVVGASFLAWALAGSLIGLASVGRGDVDAPSEASSPALALASVPVALILAVALGWWESRALRAGVSYEAGLALQRAARPAEAVPLLASTTSLWPHYYLFWAEQAYANRAAARQAPAGPEKERFYRQSFAAVERALAINDAHPLVWSYWGDIAAEVAATTGDIGLRSRARVAHLRATDLAPNWWRYWQSAGDSDMLLGEFAGAKEKYARAAALTPGNWVLWASLGDAANRATDYPAARSAYERALGLRPGAQVEATIERAIASLPAG